MKPHPKQQDRSRQPYSVPTLREFGAVGTLTQGGTGPRNEWIFMYLMTRQRT